MSTIKTQVADNVRRIITKIDNSIRKVSCSCCECFCENLDCVGITNAFAGAIDIIRDDLDPPETITINYNNNTQQITGDFFYYGQVGDPLPAGKPAPIQRTITKPNGSTFTVWTGWRYKTFCLRFVCRVVNTESEDGTVICSTLPCGPSLNELNLTEKLFDFFGQSTKENLLSVETQSGLYIYCFEFFGWRKGGFLDESYESVPADNAYTLSTFFNNLE